MALYEFDGKSPQVPADSFVHPNAVLIGDVKIGHECLIAPGVSIRADFGPVVIGDRSSIQDNAVIHVYPDSRERSRLLTAMRAGRHQSASVLDACVNSLQCP